MTYNLSFSEAERMCSFSRKQKGCDPLKEIIKKGEIKMDEKVNKSGKTAKGGVKYFLEKENTDNSVILTFGCKINEDGDKKVLYNSFYDKKGKTFDNFVESSILHDVRVYGTKNDGYLIKVWLGEESEPLVFFTKRGVRKIYGRHAVFPGKKEDKNLEKLKALIKEVLF